MLKVKKRLYPLNEFAKMLKLGDDVYLLSVDIKNATSLGSSRVDQYVIIEYIINEEDSNEDKNE